MKRTGHFYWQMTRRPRDHLDASLLMSELETCSRCSQSSRQPGSAVEFTLDPSKVGLDSLNALVKKTKQNKTPMQKARQQRRILAAVTGEYFIYGAVFPQGAMAAT